VQESWQWEETTHMPKVRQERRRRGDGSRAQQADSRELSSWHTLVMFTDVYVNVVCKWCSSPDSAKCYAREAWRGRGFQKFPERKTLGEIPQSPKMPRALGFSTKSPSSSLPSGPGEKFAWQFIVYLRCL